MFRSAVLAATSAARTWSPAHLEINGPGGCCGLCHDRYRALVLDGPLRDLPHCVAHAAVVAIDGIITEKLAAIEEQFDHEPWNVLLSDWDRTEVLARRRHAARGGLVLAAMDELAAAHAELSELRRRYTEPALTGFLADLRLDDVPEAWA